MNTLKTQIEWFYDWEEKTPNNVFLRQPYGREWKSFTFYQVGQEARKMAAALQNMGLQKGDHVGILSKNCYHWIIADIAIMIGGFVSVPYFSSLPSDQLKEVVDKSDLKAIFLGKLEKWNDEEKPINPTIKIIRFPHYNGNAKITQGTLWDDEIKNVNPITENHIPALTDIWTILFTSGTTGSPKGVVHTFNNIAVIYRQEEQYKSLGVEALKAHRYFSFLPLNHVGERIGVEMNAIKMGGSISFGESIDSFVYNLQDTQPTFFFAVPRIWTKFQQGVFARMPEKKLNLLLSLPLVSNIIKKKLRTALGLGSVEITLTGAAITPEKTKQWYRKLGINLREVYGMTEACGPITLSPIGDKSKGNVGKPMPGTKVKIDPTSGEVLYRTPQVMKCYYKEPQMTNEILRDGWIYSGDRGIVDVEGYVRIVGRVKDAFKTAKGKFVTPNPIEEEITKSNLVEQVCVAGLGIPQPIALVNLSEVAKGVERETIIITLKEELNRINSNLQAHEKVSTLIICKETWTEQNHLLTPTLKARRGKIDDRYSEKYLDWHEHQADIIWE